MCLQHWFNSDINNVFITLHFPLERSNTGPFSYNLANNSHFSKYCLTKNSRLVSMRRCAVGAKALFLHQCHRAFLASTGTYVFGKARRLLTITEDPNLAKLLRFFGHS